MGQLTRSARIYIFAISAGALACLAYFSLHPVAHRVNPAAFAFFLIFTFLTELYPVQLAGESSFTTAGIFYYAILLLFGTTPAIWIMTLAGGLSEVWQRRAWYRVCFNVSQVVVAFTAAGVVYESLSHGNLSLRTVPDELALILSALIIFLCNALLLSGVVSLTQNINFSRVWRSQWEGIISHLFVTFPVGILVALIYLEEPIAVVILVVPFFIMHYAFKARTTNRELDKRIQELSLLFEASHYLGTSLSLRRALQVLLDITQRIIPCDQAHVFLIEQKEGKRFLSLKATTYTYINPQILSIEYDEQTRALLPKDEGGGVLVNDRVEPKRTGFSFWTPDQLSVVKELYAGMEAGLQASLRHGESFLGFVEVNSRTAGAYTYDDLKLLCTLANVASVAIKNASLYEDTLDLATRDGLTGLYNHRLMQEFLDKEVARSGRENLETALVLFDIDHFKHFNDTYGHMTGDLVLKEVARIAQGCVRDGDIVARYGGEEFAIILPHTSRESALEVSERLRRSVEGGISPLFSHNMEVTISLGIATFPQDAKDKVGLVRAADAALYHAKALGRNRTSLFNREFKSPEEEQRSVIGVERVQSFLMLQIARMLANFLDIKSGLEKGHTDVIAAWVVKIGRKMGIPAEDIKVLRTAALLHHIGKIGLGQKLLRKNGPLTVEERDQIKLHPEVGATLLAQFPIFHRVAAIIYQEQERYDGKGYPLGLEKEDILLGARILAVATAFASMTTEQPFRKALSAQEAIEELRKEAGAQFDPEVVKRFIEIMEEEKSVA